MTSKLPRTVMERRDEALESLIARLAWANGFRCAADLIRPETPGSRSLRTISEQTCHELASLSGITVDTILRFRVAPGVVIPFGASKIKRSHMSLGNVRYCPHCLRSDAENDTPLRGGHQYIRGAWNWSMISCCHLHGTPLATSSVDLSALVDFQPLLRKLAYTEPVQPDEAEVYFHGRLEKPAGEAFLDGFPAYVAAEFCAVLGHIAQCWESRALKDRIVGGYENSKMRSIGYAIAKDGREAVWAFLTDYVRKASSWISQPRSFYSVTHHWWRMNKHNMDYRPLMMLLQAHAEQNVPLDRGETFFWPVLRRHVHTVRTASLEYGLPEERVTQVLTDAFGCSELPRFLKKEEIHRALLDAKSWLNTGEVAGMLGCSVQIVDRIIKAGFLTAVANSSDQTRVYRFVHRSEVEGLLSKLRDVLETDAGDADLKPVVQTRWAGGTTGILQLLIDGHLTRVFCKSDVMRLDNLLVDHRELRDVPREIIEGSIGYDDVDGDLIDLAAARRRLKTTKSVVQAIVDAGIVPHILKENRHQGRGNFRVWVRTADIDQFAREYIALDELAVERGIEPITLLAQLGRSGARPVVQGGRFIGRFYRRSDIPAT